MRGWNRRVWLALPALLLLAPGSGEGQATDPGRLHAERAELEAMLAEFENASSAQGYSGDFRARARQEAGLIVERLEQGDFRVGDQIAVTVTGQDELTATFTVAYSPQGPVLQLPNVGNLVLAGMLRSELQPSLRDHIARFIRDPEVYSHTSIRLQIFGEVTTPGYQVVPADAQLTDAIMLAGGPTGNAKQDQLRVKRGDNVIWDGEPLQTAIIEGRTLDQLSMRAGDRIEIPGKSGLNITSLLYGIGAIVPLAYALGRIF